MSTSPSAVPGSLPILVADLPTGPELLDTIIQSPSLDRLLDRDPRAVPYTDQDLMMIIAIDRKMRAQSRAKAETRKAKKQGVEE